MLSAPAKLEQSKFHRRVVGACVLLAAAFFAAGLPFVDSQGGYAGLSPRFLPTLVTVGLTICGLLLLLKKDSIQQSSDEAATALDTPNRFKRLGLLMGGLITHMILIGWIGFVLASGLLMAVTAKAYGSKRLLRDCIIGLLIAGTIWSIFTQLLGLNLPLFPLWSMLTGKR
jgi:putative tricarboxylic transport membrane protein